MTASAMPVSTPMSKRTRSKPTKPIKNVGFGQLYEELAWLALPDAFDGTEILFDMDSYDPLRQRSVSLADFFEGLTQLATTGSVKVTDIVAAIHCEIMLRPIGRFNHIQISRWQKGILGRLYHLVRHQMQMLGDSVGSILHIYDSYNAAKKSKPLPDSLKLFVNALNGLMGDHLVSQDNPIALPMMFYNQYGHPHSEELSGRIIIMVHGLCMSYMSWHLGKKEGMGEHILDALSNSTILYLDYNTGRRISINGHELAQMLQYLVENNPDITQIDLIGHSMGGLVIRSALFYAKLQGYKWVECARNMITIGSPHHGAVLERIGHHAQDVIAKIPFAGSLAKLADVRSAGIIDLRHGSIRDEDWKNLAGRTVLPDAFRYPTQLPRHINGFFMAGSLEDGLHQSKVSRLLGDGLVTIDSALGEHPGEQALFVPEGHKAIFYKVGHIELQYNDRVHRQVIKWLLGQADADALSLRIYSYPNEG